ncbi:two-component system, OmpR family, sensor histidine kinase KdpD [Catalinimonas alkaloidigena]|uniref:Two-component system, OmpR family, sensor histidine kinase KdpD n=1 Tax=Catalinimonas alkaloidigena TaxID=1075417 RepID=A0A1G8YAX3_9BACT|nr:histidine kinase [Catalinimonas alkaloidigena]SDK00002.1 two-component system, OmpR family, sensor histidine kinase KdpD [Catalinimonas alkaloidigena]
MAPPENDSFLNLIRPRQRGRLKVYIGMIAGVGKTYRMLQEAHELLAAGVDVKIGLVEPHDRAETLALVDGLPQIARKKVFYKGRAWEEMDLEAILETRPEVVLVDELAHTNLPGSLHEKRWQDVLALLAAGIHVITAFNVQHLESVVDRVERIAGIEVRERIPDKLLAYADEVVNLDLPAEDLIKRLKEGKIYRGDRIQRALEHFFRPDQILQLRDLALRQVAALVERKIQRSLPQASRMPLERFLACISTNDEGARKIIRKTARLAAHYQASWWVLYVQLPRERSDRIALATQRKLLHNLKWATELGAEVVRAKGEDVPELIYQTAIAHQITTLVLGKPHFSAYRQLTGRNYFDRLLKKLVDREIDVVLVF